MEQLLILLFNCAGWPHDYTSEILPSRLPCDVFYSSCTPSFRGFPRPVPAKNNGKLSSVGPVLFCPFFCPFWYFFYGILYVLAYQRYLLSMLTRMACGTLARRRQSMRCCPSRRWTSSRSKPLSSTTRTRASTVSSL